MENCLGNYIVKKLEAGEKALERVPKLEKEIERLKNVCDTLKGIVDAVDFYRVGNLLCVSSSIFKRDELSPEEIEIIERSIDKKEGYKGL